MSTRRSAVIAGAIVGAVGVVTAGVAGAAGIGDQEGGAPVTDAEARSAISAALAATGGGTANSVERDSEDGATWEVEVTRIDGSTVDVRLDADYAVVVIDSDDESSDTDD
jgi:hypothetical protein